MRNATPGLNRNPQPVVAHGNLANMLSRLLSLPRELREHIWLLVCQKDAHSVSPFAFDLLRTCRLLSLELAPYLYESATIDLRHPRHVLQWISIVGAYNSSCVRRLVLKYSALDLNLGKIDRDDALDVWSSSLAVMPNLDYLIYHYEPSRPYKPYRYMGNLPDELPKLNSILKGATSPKLPMKGILNVNNYDDDVFEGESTGDRRYTHAVLAIYEPVPQINAKAFIKLLGFNSALSLEQNVTRLPPGFLAGHGLHLMRTYTMTEDPQNQSVALTYSRCNPSVPKVKPNLQLMFSNLPRLLYLRLGCPVVDSSFLRFLPTGIQTLDVAFKDGDPTNVARNLCQMRQRCPKLFTLAIVVSPLHDVYRLPDGGRAIDQQSAGEANIIHWEPFWAALRYVQSTEVKVWEGYGPGSKKW